jgi:hypothetical protein
MSRIVVRSGPTRLERAAILFGCHLLTLAGLLAWTLVSPSPGGAVVAVSAGSAAVAVSPARASVMTVGNGYVVERRDWQPPATPR